MATRKTSVSSALKRKACFNLDLIIVEIADKRFAVVGGETNIGHALRLLRFEQRKGFGLVEQRQQFQRTDIGRTASAGFLRRWQAPPC